MSARAGTLAAARMLYGAPRPVDDAELERQIAAACDEMTRHLAAGRTAQAHQAEARMRWLIGRRSPEQVARLERARGLRPADGAPRGVARG